MFDVGKHCVTHVLRDRQLCLSTALASYSQGPAAPVDMGADPISPLISITCNLFACMDLGHLLRVVGDGRLGLCWEGEARAFGQVLRELLPLPVEQDAAQVQQVL